jgi:dihydroorotase (multifunctional complex type)
MLLADEEHGLRCDLAILNGRLIDEHGERAVDIAVSNGRIAALEPSGSLRGTAAEEIDAAGLWVLPGFVDPHVHCRAPDHPEREDFASGSAAAAAAGITTFLEMPIADVGVDRVEVFEHRRQLAEAQAHVDFGLYAAAGSLDRATVQALADAGACAFKIFTLQVPPARRPSFSGICLTEEADILTALRLIAETGLVCAVHAENDSLLAAGYRSARELGLTGAVAHAHAHQTVSEAMAVAWLAVLAEASGARVHIVHITSAWALDYLRFAQSRGLPMSGETCPHYLLFNEDDFMQHGTWAKIAPPLRRRTDQEALWQGLRDGTLSFIASDHAPFLPHEKDIPDILATPSGLPNLEAFPPLMLSAALEGRLPFSQMVGLLTAGAARLYNLYPQKGVIQPGSDADMVLYDAQARSRIDINSWFSRSRSSARIFHDIPYRGRILRTLVRGRTVYHDGHLVGASGYGRLVRPAR